MPPRWRRARTTMPTAGPACRSASTRTGATRRRHATPIAKGENAMTGTSRLVVPALGPAYRALAPVTEMLVRLCAGVSLAVHGGTILFGNHEDFARFFESAGFVPGLFWTFAVA